MTAAAISRDALMPRRPAGMGAGLLLALLAHALLVAALAFSVRWKTSEPAGVEAELWAAVPQVAAPRAAAPEPVPVPEVKPAPPPPPPPPPKVEPAPQPVPDAQIAIERAKREEAKQKRLEEEKREAELREALKLEQQRAKEELERKKKDEAAKLKLEKQQEKQQEEKLAAAREANLKRILGQAGASGEPTSTGSAAKSAGPSAGYAGRIRARIQPNIVFADSVSGNPMATVEVRLAPDGTINAKKLVKSSGVKAWDDAVLRAIDKTEVLPRDTDGRVPPVIEIDFRPYD